MSKVNDELHRDLLSAAAILAVIGGGTKTMNPEYAGHLSGLLDRARAALEAVSSIHEAEPDVRTWFELREPGCVPERKGPMPPTMVAGFLRELFEHRPRAYVTVITIGHGGPLLQDGPECLQMLDGRSMSVGRRAIENMRAAHQTHPAPISKGVTEGAHVSSLWQNKIDDMSQAYGILESQHREQRLRAQKLDDNLSLAIETLLNYADPSGYVDGDGNLPEHDEGALARSTLAKIAPYDARVKSCLSHTAGEP